MHGFYKRYIHTAVTQGRLPLWNPYHWLGRPFLADPESAFFYPPEALYWFLDARLACGIVTALHLVLCEYGTLRLSRALGASNGVSLFAGVAFAASAPIIGSFAGGLIHYGQALCFTPLVLYLGLRIQARPTARGIGLLALMVGLDVLCGHPQATWVTLVGLAAFLCSRRLRLPFLASLAGLGADLVMIFLAVALGFAIAAVVVLPLAELAAEGNRVGTSMAFTATLAEPARGWATLFLPAEMPFLVVPAGAQMYVGTAALVAGCCGFVRLQNRVSRSLLLLAVFAGLLLNVNYIDSATSITSPHQPPG